MKTIEIRRHSIRSGVDLSQASVSLARQVGDEIGPFNWVVTSPISRAVHTAIAMGFAVNQTAELLASLENGLPIDCPYGSSFSEFSKKASSDSSVTQLIKLLANFYQQLAISLPENGSALVINHSGMVEYSTVACLPNENLDHLGDNIKFCEGARITWDNGTFTATKILRVQQWITSNKNI